MLLFGHVGVTIGGAYVVSWIANRTLPSSDPHKPTTQRGPVFRGRVLDWRLLVIGALLPDIIDKPIGILLFSSQGRLVAHTLLFTVVLGVIGLLLAFRGRPWLLIVAICSAGHLVLDLMWRQPAILYWPLHGWHILPSYHPLDWSAFKVWIHLLTRTAEGGNHLVMAFEIVGGIVVAIFLLQIFLNRGEEHSKD